MPPYIPADMNSVRPTFLFELTRPVKTWAARACAIGLLLGQAPHRIADAAAPLRAAHAEQFTRNFDGARLTDAHGRHFDPQALTGQVVLYHFIFTGCSTVCPTQAADLKRVLDRMAPEVRQRVHIVSVSIDPLSDTPAALKAYARRIGADHPGWHFVSPRPVDVTRLSDSMRLLPAGAGAAPAAHATALWVVDAAGRLRMRYDGTKPDVPRLVRELTLLATPPAPPQTRPGT